MAKKTRKRILSPVVQATFAHNSRNQKLLEGRVFVYRHVYAIFKLSLRKAARMRTGRYQTQKGFTLVELLVIIAMTGVLATIGTLSLARFLADGRDSHRASDALVVAEALEKYYDANGEYPSCGAMTQSPSTIKTSVLEGIDEAVLLSPTDKGSTKNSIKCQQLATTEDLYSYQGDSSAACTSQSGLACTRFTLSYIDEGSGEIQEISSRRRASIATSLAPTLAGTLSNHVNISLSWNAISGADTYTLERATDSNFTSGYVEQANLTTLSSSVQGLNNTTYYFRVRGSDGIAQSNWSNVYSVTTTQATGPTLTASTTGFTTASLSWTAVSGYPNLTLQRASNASFSENLIENPRTGTSMSVTGLTQNTTYYFRIQGVSGNATTTWSATRQITTNQMPTAPSAPTIETDGDSNQSRAWVSSGVGCNIGNVEYRIDYRINNGTWTTATNNATSYTHTEGNPESSQGNIHNFRAYARCYAHNTYSGWSAVSNTTTYTRPISTPSTPGIWLGYDSGSYSMTFAWNPTYCPTNTTPQYQRMWGYEGYASSWSTTSASSFSVTMFEGHNGYANVQQRCARGSVVSGWSGSGTASYITPITNPSGSYINWARSGNGSSGTFTWGTTCRAGAWARYDANFWIGNGMWANGSSGWLGGDYPYNDTTATSMNLYNQNGGNTVSAIRHAAKVRFECYNGSTGRVSNSEVQQTGQVAY